MGDRGKPVPPPASATEERAQQGSATETRHTLG